MTRTDAKNSLRTATRWLAVTAGLATLAACGWAGPAKPLFTARGVVTDEAGKPVPGAVVSDGRVGVLTDEAGRYNLALFDKAIKVKKPGFHMTTLEADAQTAAKVSLRPSGEQARVAIDTRWVGARMDNFRDTLQREGYALKNYPATPLSQLDVLMVVTPGAFRAEELDGLRGWLKAGGRLILCGEWGGYPAQDLDLLNSLAEDAGITFTGATVKLTDAAADGGEWMNIQGLNPPSFGKLAGADPMHLFTTTSLALTSPAMPLFSTDRGAYSVLAARTGPQVVAAVGANGLGKVFALGDSSLWLDEDSGGQGSPNWRRGGNLKLAEAMFQW